MARPIDYSKWEGIGDSSDEDDEPMKKQEKPPQTPQQQPGARRPSEVQLAQGAPPWASLPRAQRTLAAYQSLYHKLEGLLSRCTAPEHADAQMHCKEVLALVGNRPPRTFDGQLYNMLHNAVVETTIYFNTIDERAVHESIFRGSDFERECFLLVDAVNKGDADSVRKTFAERSPALKVGTLSGRGQGQNYVSEAASNNQPAMINLLLGLCSDDAERRAVLEQKDMHGDTPLLSAARAHSAACFRTLVAAGADYASPVTNLGSTALHLACNEGCLEIVKQLCEGGVELNTHTYMDELTPLHFAVSGRYYGGQYAECVEYLVVTGPRAAEVDFLARTYCPDRPHTLLSLVLRPAYVNVARPWSARVRQIVVEEAARREAARPGSADPENLLGLRPGPRAPAAPDNPLAGMMSMMGLFGGGGSSAFGGGYIPDSDPPTAAAYAGQSNKLPTRGRVARFSSGACIIDPENLAPSEYIRPSAAWRAVVSTDLVQAASASADAESFLAFLGARHPRLGSESPARSLPKTAIAIIAAALKPQPRKSCLEHCSRAARRAGGGGVSAAASSCPCRAAGVPCFGDCYIKCAEANPLTRLLPATDCARDHASVVLSLTRAQRGARYPLACAERWGAQQSNHSVDGSRGTVPLHYTIVPGQYQFEGCDGCGGDGAQFFSFCLNRLVNADRVNHCLICGRCYYYRSGFIQGSCPYCQCSPDEDERGEMDRQPGGGTRVEDDDMERGLALEGYWGF